MCSQTMMSSTETQQGFKVTKAFSQAPRSPASGTATEELKHVWVLGDDWGGPSLGEERILLMRREQIIRGGEK